jgi:hypothetical protein
VLWSFNGQPCVFVPNVASVRVIIPGATLQNGGLYPCMTNNVSGITLLNFRSDSYTVTVEGLDSFGRVIYSGTSQAFVNGDVTVSINLTPLGNATGTALVSWVFPQNLSCAQAGDPASGRFISRMFVSIDGQAPQTVDCNQGNATAANPAAALTIQNLGGANHTIDIQAADSTNFVFFRGTGSLSVIAGGSVSAQFALSWVVGSLPLRWTFSNNNVQIGCQQAQVDRVFLNFRNQQTGQFVYVDAQGQATPGAEVPCVSRNNIEGTFFPFFTAGNYDVFVQAPVRNNAYTYASSPAGTQPPVLQVQAGVFAQSEAMGQVVILR